MTGAQKGQLAEELVAARLQKLGYEILCRNYRVPVGEIDIVARDGGCIVFIEVRARGAGGLVAPLESIDARKRKKIIAAAYCYLEEHPSQLQPRFDAAAVTVLEGVPSDQWPWEHLKAAFDGSDYHADY